MHRRVFLSTSLMATIAMTLRASYNDPLVINAGVGGNNTDDLLKRIDKDCLAHKPALTVLMAGTNDMNSRKYIPLEQYRKNMATLIEKIQASKSKVLLMTILPFYEPYLLTRHDPAFYGTDGPAKRRAAVNETIKSLAAAYKTELLDLGILFEKVGKVGLDKDSLIQNEANSQKTDGIHPTPNGYRFIGLAVYEHILLQKLPQSRIVCFGDSITNGDGSVTKESYPAYLNKLLQS
ncbi:SGNH/GDSL hydrolase family protein [Chitinophaga niabensis]|uniref:GDSL-like Lipase/Acylhydrolase family protein n=1 Tax=Chitinophaga niabensis TaxID=536979 RepID=A0A1N6F545_9BACT|nr:SGNH/GDSL hydrolase family protein [Chitinophaga niabensis]SIN90403.1 GDSL-like Lipase/Acylhydrolase family protein [Chitinophaga niabensis]